MRLSRRALIALSIMLGAIDARAQSHIRESLLRVNAYDDTIEARRLDEARAAQRRLDEHREETHREEAHREEEHRDEAHREETRREARIHAYNAWLQRWHETRTIEATTP
ncbi:hypothetical protein [Paraburkholderia azotifigens]|uniref:Uncharacterized protein n=1 Tax=Paraburkholderia azotifigens TaxID=2057004 RepID=A0A5C6V4A0_9BURK|nr:hypothetical protein [Paraburkholderia azotifigens]TXC79899.1 hypothetical protein FRZ40_36895 [Paraburkholderia azotifigens]